MRCARRCAQNVVLVGGLDYAYDLSGMAQGFALKDAAEGHGIILSTHIYPWKKGWQEKVLVMAKQAPIFVGEVGANTEKMSWLKPEWQRGCRDLGAGNAGFHATVSSALDSVLVSIPKARPTCLQAGISSPRRNGACLCSGRCVGRNLRWIDCDRLEGAIRWTARI